MCLCFLKRHAFTVSEHRRSSNGSGHTDVHQARVVWRNVHGAEPRSPLALLLQILNSLPLLGPVVQPLASRLEALRAHAAPGNFLLHGPASRFACHLCLVLCQWRCYQQEPKLRTGMKRVCLSLSLSQCRQYHNQRQTTFTLNCCPPH